MAERRNLTLAVLALPAVLAIAAGGFATRHGSGLSPDSAVYVAAAQSLLDHSTLAVPFGESAATPLVHFPPLYPAVLAALATWNTNLFAAARWWNVLLFGANTLLVGLLIYWETRSTCAAAVGAVLACASVDLLAIHTMIWSEPTFVLFLLGSVLLLAVYLETTRTSALLLSSAAAAAAWTTRYLGLPLVAAGAIGLLLWFRSSPKRMCRDILIFGLISSLPIAVWTSHRLGPTGTVAGRTAAFHPVTGQSLLEAAHHVSRWVLPERIALPVRVAALVLLLALAVLYRRRWLAPADREHPGLLRILALFLGLYLFTLFISMSFFDAGTELDERILSPVFVASLIGSVCLFHRWWRASTAGPGLRLLAGVLCLIFVLCYVRRGAVWVSAVSADGRGYAGRLWKDSSLFQRLRQIDAPVIYSNVPDAVYLLTGRPALWLPFRVNPTTLHPNSAYTQEMAALRSGALVVYVRSLQYRWFLPTENELREQITLHAVAAEREGAIYRLDEPGGVGR